MKRIALLTIIFVLISNILTGCMIIPQYKRFKIEEATVASIEIYDLCEVDSIYGNFVETETPIYEIPAEEVDDFLSNLAKIRFSDTIIIALMPTDPSFYFDDWTVRINYSDESYELISCDGYGKTFNKNGETADTHHFSCNQDKWSEFISKYIPQDIFEHSHKAE